MRVLPEVRCKNPIETSLDIQNCVEGGGDSLSHITGKFKGNACRNGWNQEHKKGYLDFITLSITPGYVFLCIGFMLGQDFYRL